VPPEPREFAAIRLVRVPTTGILQGIVTSHDVIGCWTHWDSYRTQPCPGENCDLCRKGHPRRWQGYFSVYSDLTRRQAVIQITPIAAQTLRAAKEQYGYLRGLLVGLSRIAKRPNARIAIETRQLPQPPADLPEAVDIPKYMSLIWQTNGDLH